MHVNPDEANILVDEEILETVEKLVENKTQGTPNIAQKVAARIVPSLFAQVLRPALEKENYRSN